MTGFAKAVTIIRPADTSAYLANDIIGTATGSTAAQLFDGLGPSAFGNYPVLITSCSLMIYDTGLISGETSYALHLYSGTVASALGDNAPFDVPSGDRTNYLGSIALGTPVDLGSTLYVEQAFINKHVTLVGGVLYGYLVTAGPYTPTSGRTYVVKIHARSA